VPVVVEVSAQHLYRRTDPMVVRRFRIHDEQANDQRPEDRHRNHDGSPFVMTVTASREGQFSRAV
jgi:hypothetical protein